MAQLRLNFDAMRWQQAAENWQAWWDGGLKRPLVMLEGYQPGWKAAHPDVPPKPNWTFTGRYPQDWPDDAVLDQYQQALEAGFFAGDSLPKFYVNLGPGALAAFLGSEYQLFKDTGWFSPPKDENGLSWTEKPLDQIHLQFDPQNALWQRTYRLTERATQRWGGEVIIGMTDLGGNLDILASLIGSERLAVEMLDHPEEIDRLCAEIRAAWLLAYDRLDALYSSFDKGSACWASIWAPRRCYMLQSDFAYMISPRLFKRFVMPDLQACCEALDYPFYHLDGEGEIRHLDQLLTIEKLRGIQWIPGAGAAPPEEWMPLLKRIRDGGKLCQLYISAEGARKVVRELGGEGFAFDIDDEMTEEEAWRFAEELIHG